ncbi:MAG: hypothetical protein WC600_03985 [Desulfobaccales bacterium]
MNLCRLKGYANDAFIFNIGVTYERQGQKVLLFPPVESTMWVEWPIKRPKGDYFVYYHYVSLMIQPGQETNDLNLVVVARIADSPKKFVREIFKERHRAGWEFNDMHERVDEWEEEESDHGEIYSDRGLAG